MNYLYAIILGVVQGIAEFLPISSSGHLLVLHDFFGIEFADNLAFDVFLHWGTLLALLIYFYKDIIRYLRAFINSLRHWKSGLNPEEKMAWLILLSMIPALLVGIFLNDWLDTMFRNSLSVAIFLITVAFIMIWSEKAAKKKLTMASLTWGKVLWIGIAQALALIPGVSRSGSTISSALFLGLKREDAARFTFLMSVPIVFAAGCKKLYDMFQEKIIISEPLVFFAGFVAAALVGYLVINFLLNYLKNHSLVVFAVYRIIFGLLILIIIFLR